MRRLSMTLTLLVALTPTTRAQDDRRDRNEPELVVEAGGRTGTCDELFYNSDGSLLFAGGDDKVVRIWPNRPDGLDLPAMKTLRWPAWREQRGGIKTIAVSPDSSQVLVGGFGLRTSAVALINCATGNIIAITLPEASGSNLFGVMTAAFRPDGQEVAFGTADGSLWTWDLKTKPRFVARHGSIPRAAGPSEFNRPRLVFYRNDKLVSVAQGGEVREDDPAGKAPGQVLATVHKKLKPRLRAFRAVPSADRNWIAIGANGPVLTLLDLTGARTRSIELKEGEFPRSLALSRDGKRLAVGVGSLVKNTPFHLEADHRIDLYADPLTANKPQPAAGPPHTNRAEAMAFDHLGRLAVAGGDSHEVRVWELGEKPRLVTMVRGSGRGVWAARVSQSGRSIGFQTARDARSADPNRRGRGPWQAFDLVRPRAQPAEPEWVEPLATADGWRVEPSPVDKYTWSVVRHVNGRDLPPIRLDLDPDRDEAPQCYTFLPAQGDRPTRLVVGHYYGSTVFDLVEGRPVKLTRCIGHAGEVTSVSPGPDHQWFISAGTDQTIAAWSLDDRPSDSRLGTTFTVNQGKLVVGEVVVGSPAWEMGLIKGDEIQLAVVGSNRPMFNVSGKTEPQYGPRIELSEQVLRALADPRPGVSLHLGWRRAGHDQLFERFTTLIRRPLWKLFPGYDDQDRLTEWIVWLWKTGHYHTSTHGDSLIGWHVNHPVETGTPRFYEAEKFRTVFHKPHVIIPLLMDRNYSNALKRALGDNPQPISFGSLEPPPLSVRSDTPVAKADAVTVHITLRQRGGNPDLMPQRVELWINDWRYKKWGAHPKGMDEPVTIPVDKLRAGENVVTVQTFNRLGGRGEAQIAIRNPKNPGKPRLLGVTIGVNDYAGAGKNTDGSRQVGDLKSARKDAESIRERLLEYSGENKYFPQATVAFLADARANRQAILANLDDLAKRTGPDDRVIIFLAGHGDFVKITGKNGKPEGFFVFCCPNYDSKKYDQTGVTAAELFDKLAAIPGRKLVLLDACHSGQAAEVNMIRALVPSGQGPTIMAACDQTELSYENKELNNGLFTSAVLEALGKKFEAADKNHDNALGTDEVYEYVRKRVPELLKQIGMRPYAQNPICFPLKQTPFAIVQKQSK